MAKTKIRALPGPTTVTSIKVWVREFLDGSPQDPIPDADVTLTSAATGKVVATGLTDVNGNFKATFLPIGDYYVRVFKALYGPIPTVGNKPATAAWMSPKTYCGSIAALPKDPARPGDALPVLFDVRLAIELATPNFMMEFGDRLDYDFGELLKDMSRFPVGSHAHQVAHFTHSEMKANNLIGVVSAGKSLTVLKDKLPADEHERLKTGYVASGDIAANAYYFGLQNDPRRRGYVLISNSNSAVARQSGFARDRAFLAAVFSHEINHYRNRVLIDGIGPGAATFVNPALAASTDGDGTRYRFINELAARHAGWHVTKDIAGATGPHVPAAGAFWNQIADFSAWYNAFQDAGYMQGLGAVDRQKQACEWLKTCAAVMIYHYDSGVNKAIQAMMKSEANLGAGNGYMPIAGVASDGFA